MPKCSFSSVTPLTNLIPSTANVVSTLMMSKVNKLILLQVEQDSELHFSSIHGIGISCHDHQIHNRNFEPISFSVVDYEYSIEDLRMVEVREQVYLLSILNILGKYKERIDRVIFDENDQSVKLECVFHENPIEFIKLDTSPIADSTRNCIYIVGGINLGDGSQYAKDVVKFSLETFTWEIIGSFNRSPAMYCQSSLFWKEKYIIVFGGFHTSCSATSDILAFNVESKEWSILYAYDSSHTDPIYPRIGAGMQLVSSKWASQFDRTIPSTTQENTLFIYGGFIDCFIQKTEINRATHEVYLFHLEECENQRRIPFSLTDHCTPEERKLPPIHRRPKKNPVTNSNGILLDDKDDSEEFKLLPLLDFNIIHKINNTQLLVIGNDCYLISLNEESMFKQFDTNKLGKLSDISIESQTFQ